MSIDPKPTTYHRTEFRSRLEARWAVYFDHYALVDQWNYEPRKFTDPRTRWTYTPDFFVAVGRGTLRGWVEVKPEVPNQDTLDSLHRSASLLGRCQGFHLALAFGSFFQGEEPRVFMMGPSGDPPSIRDVEENATFLSDIPILGDRDASKVAQDYRFDLPERRPSFRTPHGKTPWDYWKGQKSSRK